TMQQLIKKNKRLEEMINKLISRDFSVSQPITDDPKLLDLQNRIISLGAWITQSKDDSASIEQLEKTYALQMQERDNELETLRETIRNMTQTISGLEETFSSTSEELQSINNEVSSYKEKIDEQSDTIQHAEHTISESALLINNLSVKMNESAAFSAELEKEITNGEEQVIEVSDLINGISTDLEKIQDITRTINKIAEQTNILSMNAAIESAHAGSAGAGFGVVADEIRKLAESTRENADQISREVNALMEKIKEALKASKDSSVSFSGITERIRSFSEEIISINVIAAQSLEKTEMIPDLVRKTAEHSPRVPEKTDQIEPRIVTQNVKPVKPIEPIEEIAQKKSSADNAVSFVKDVSDIAAGTGAAGIVAAARDITDEKNADKPEPPKSETYTLRLPTESEKLENSKMRESIETVELPAGRNVSSAAASETNNEETDYDERGVAVKRPPTTIF
ncbi:MAG: methyl-accepting chemotaxis protein, partial [Treponema sp.]|nr:methyl-accepting chemotaxis protein [Treponema sp.]